MIRIITISNLVHDFSVSILHNSRNYIICQSHYNYQTNKVYGNAFSQACLQALVSLIMNIKEMNGEFDVCKRMGLFIGYILPANATIKVFWLSTFCYKINILNGHGQSESSTFFI